MRLAAAHGGIEDRRDVCHLIAVGVGEAKLGSARHGDHAAQLDLDTGLLEGFTARGLLRALVGLEHPADRLPQPGFGVQDHQHASGLVACEHGDRRREHEIVPDLGAKIGQVGRDGHYTSLEKPPSTRSAAPVM
ncbi:MAG TPA: hypothetical protein VID68_12500 [Solirubrobacteraceae bacterium]